MSTIKIPPQTATKSPVVKCPVVKRNTAKNTTVRITTVKIPSTRLAANHYQLANRRTLYDFLRQSLKLKNNSKNFRDFEKCELAYKIHFRQFPRYFSSAILEKFENQIS